MIRLDWRGVPLGGGITRARGCYMVSEHSVRNGGATSVLGGRVLRWQEVLG